MVATRPEPDGTVIAVARSATRPAPQPRVTLELKGFGRIDFIPEQISTAYPGIVAGNVKGIATLAANRPPVLPDLPMPPLPEGPPTDLVESYFSSSPVP